jgi:DNA-binding NarL/FixJ family response regulator
LSERELEVLALLAADKSDRQIARELFVAFSTVKIHIKNIYGKLDVRTARRPSRRLGSRNCSKRTAGVSKYPPVFV